MRKFLTGKTADLTIKDRAHRIRGVTNDDRVAELVEEIAKHSVDMGSSFDAIITPLASGSPDYIEWI